MAVAVSSYSPYMYDQQSYYSPAVSSFYYPQPVPVSYYAPQQQPQPQPQPQPQQQQPISVEYIDSGAQPSYPRRVPRVYRQVIVLPTPEPIYRQVRHRLPTPERKVIQRSIVHKTNGDVVVQQQTTRRSQSRSQPSTQSRASRSRQIYTD